MDCGTLKYLKSGDDTVSVFHFEQNKSFSIGTAPDCYIGLKVETRVPEHCIFTTDSEGFTKFINNNISEYYINGELSEDVRYLLPGDIIDLHGKQFQYQNSTLSNEDIEVLCRKNDKSFCLDNSNENELPISHRKQQTSGRRTTIARTFSAFRNVKMGTPKSIYNFHGADFIEEDIGSEPITPSRSNKYPVSLSNLEINLELGNLKRLMDSPEADDCSVKGETEYSDDRPRDLDFDAQSNLTQIVNCGENVTMLADISYPRASDTPQSPSDVSADTPPMLNRTVNVEKTPKSILKKTDHSQRRDTPKAEDASLLVGDENALPRRPILEKSILSKRFGHLIVTPKVDGGRTHSIKRRASNLAVESDLQERTPKRDKRGSEVTLSDRVTRNSTSKTPKTPVNGRKVLSESTNFVIPSTTSSPNVGVKTAYVQLIRRRSVTECKTSPRKCSERLSKVKITRRYSEAIQSSEFVSPKKERNEEKSPDTLQFPISTNSSFVTVGGSARKAGYSSVNEQVYEKQDASPSNDNVDYSSGSSADHYESDKEESKLEKSITLSGISSLEASAADSPNVNSNRSSAEDSALKRNSLSLSDGGNVQDEHDQTHSSVFSFGSSSHHYESPNVATGSVNKRRMSTANELTDTEAIEDLLDISEKASRCSLNDLIECRDIEELLDAEEVAEDDASVSDESTPKNASHAAKPSPKTPKNDLSLVGGVKRLLATPKSDQKYRSLVRGVKRSVGTSPNTSWRASEAGASNVRDVKRLKTTPRPTLEEAPENDSSDGRGVKKSIGTPRASRPDQENDLNNVGAVKKSMTTRKDPRNDLSDVKGVKKLMATPRLSRKDPENDLRDVRGVKKLLATPKPPPKSPKNDLSDIKGVKKLMATPRVSRKDPDNDLRDVRGVKNLLATPKPQKPPKNDLSEIKGVKKLMATPRPAQKDPENDLRDVRGVKKLMATPKVQQKSPRNDLSDVRGVKKLMRTPRPLEKDPRNDLSDVRGVKQLMASPKPPQNRPKNDLTEVRGVKKLMATPRPTQKDPENDLRDVRGVKKLMATPKARQKTPRNDLSDVRGVKKLLRTPRPLEQDPENDLRDVRGVKQLMASPKPPQKPPRNDFTEIRGVKKLMATPKPPHKSPRNDLSDIKGVKKMLATPRVQRQPRDDLSDVEGVADLLATPKPMQTSYRESLIDIVDVPISPVTPEMRKPLEQVKSAKKSTRSARRVRKTPKDDSGVVEGVGVPSSTQETLKDDLADVTGALLATSTPSQKSPKVVSAKRSKQLKATSKQPKTPKNDLRDVRGVKDLFRIFENRTEQTETDYDGLKELFQLETDDDSRDPFDKLTDRKSFKTYKGKGVSPRGLNTSLQQQQQVSPTVLEWVEDQSKRVTESQEPKKRPVRGATKRKDRVNNNEGSAEEVAKRPLRETRRKKIENLPAESEQVEKPTTRAKRGRAKAKGDDEEQEVVVSEKPQTRRAVRGKTLKDAKESSVAADLDEAHEQIPKARTRRNGRKEEIEIQEVQEDKESDGSENKVAVKKPPPKRGRKKKPEVEDEEKLETAVITPQRAKRGRVPIITVTNEEEIPQQKKGRGRAKRKDLDAHNSSITEIPQSTGKKRLFNLDSYTEGDLPPMDQVPTQQNSSAEKEPAKNLRSQRSRNLPKMLEGYEVVINRKSTGNTPKKTPKRGTGKRKAVVVQDTEPEVQIRRSKRSRK